MVDQQNPGCLGALLELFFGEARANRSSPSAGSIQKQPLSTISTVSQQSEETVPLWRTLGFPQYKKRECLFSFRERVFYRALRAEMSRDFTIFAKVRLADLLWLPEEIENRKYFNNQTQCKHIDFVLCRKWDLQPMLAIELDDSSHDRFDHRDADDFKDGALNIAGLSLLRMRLQEHYSGEEIREQIRNKLVTPEDLDTLPWS